METIEQKSKTHSSISKYYCQLRDNIVDDFKKQFRKNMLCGRFATFVLNTDVSNVTYVKF